MLEKGKIYPEFYVPANKNLVDVYHNPYLSKLSIKLTPKLGCIQQKKRSFLNPLSTEHNLYLTQSIPFYRNERVRLAFVWKQYLSNKFARAHFGISAEYKQYENWRAKCKFLFGSTSLLEWEASRTFQNEYQLSLNGQNFVENNNMFHSAGVGIRKGNFAANLVRRVFWNTNAYVSYEKPIKDCTFYLKSQCDIDEIKRGELQIGLSYKLPLAISALLGVSVTPYYQEYAVKVQFAKEFKGRQNILLYAEASDNKSTIYFGYKSPSFHIALPFFMCEGIIPIAVASLAVLAGYLWNKLRKVATKQVLIKENKQIQERIDELRLISDKANQSYERERQCGRNGLLIEEAYVGPKDLLDTFLADPQRHILLLRNEEYKKAIFDITVTLRFFVSRSSLNLRKGNKKQLLGFYCLSEDDIIYIRFKREGRDFQRYYQLQDQILIESK